MFLHRFVKNFKLKFPVRQLSRSSSETRADIEGNHIHYLKVGSGDHPVLCLPGLVGTIWTDFKPQIEGLNPNDFTVVAMDPLGYGKSRPPNRSFPMDFYETDALIASKLMKGLGFNYYSLLGWSDGGISALIMSSKYPKEVRKLIVWGANAYVTEEDLKLYEVIKNTENWSTKILKPLEEIYGKEGLSIIVKSWWNTLDGIRRNGGHIVTKEQLNQITAAVYILHGDRDPLVPISHPNYLHENIINSRLHRYPDGKHNIHLKYAEDFNKLITDFLKR